MKTKIIAALLAITGSFMMMTNVSQAASNGPITSDSSTMGNLGIKIDGRFDDWSDKTKVPMYASGDSDNAKYTSFLRDNDNIYLYILMKPKLQGGYTNFMQDGYDLRIANKSFYISFNNHQTVNLNVGETKPVSMNIYSNDANVNLDDHVYVGRQKIIQKMGDGSDVEGAGYVFEAAIPWKDLKGVSSTMDQKVELYNPNLWSGKITAVGGSTGPVLLAGTGAIIALVSVLKISGFSFKKFKRA